MQGSYINDVSRGLKSLFVILIETTSNHVGCKPPDKKTAIQTQQKDEAISNVNVEDEIR